jgi:hypothetical protein
MEDSFPVVEVEIDQVADAVKDIRTLHAKMQPMMDYMEKQTGIPRISIRLSEWYPSMCNKDLYFSVNIFLDKYDPEYYSLRVVEGYKGIDDEFVCTDSFVDIKNDIPSIQAAISDLKKGTIPLYNKGYYVDCTAHTYIRQDESTGDIRMFISIA